MSELLTWENINRFGSIASILGFLGFAFGVYKSIYPNLYPKLYNSLTESPPVSAPESTGRPDESINSTSLSSISNALHLLGAIASIVGLIWTTIHFINLQSAKSGVIKFSDESKREVYYCDNGITSQCIFDLNGTISVLLEEGDNVYVLYGPAEQEESEMVTVWRAVPTQATLLGEGTKYTWKANIAFPIERESERYFFEVIITTDNITNSEVRNLAILLDDQKTKGRSYPITVTFERTVYKVDTFLEKLPKMSNEELRKYLGQLFMVGVEEKINGDAKFSETKNFFQNNHIGGFFLEQRNIPDLDHADHIKESMQSGIDGIRKEVAGETNLPLFIAAAHDGGDFSPFVVAKHPFLTRVPSPMAVAASRSLMYAKEVASIIASDLSALGVNMVLGPTLDINTSGSNDFIRDRSFGGHQSLVTALGKAYWETYSQHGLVPVVKHYPGMGNVTEGFDTPALPKSFASPSASNLNNTLAPFRPFVSTHSCCILASHYALTALDGENSAAIRPPFPGALRGGKDSSLRGVWEKIRPLNYDGIAIIDDLGAVSLTVSEEENTRIIGLESEAERKKEREEINKEYANKVAKNVIDAFDAGYDMFVLSHISKLGEPTSQSGYRIGLTFDEFKNVVLAQLTNHIFADKDNKRAREHLQTALRRIFSEKKSLAERIERGNIHNVSARNKLHKKSPDRRGKATVASDIKKRIVYLAPFKELKNRNGVTTLLSFHANLTIEEKDELNRLREDQDTPTNFSTLPERVKRNKEFIKAIEKIAHKVPLVNELMKISAWLDTKYQLDLKDAITPSYDEMLDNADRINHLSRAGNIGRYLFLVDNNYQIEEFCITLKKLLDDSVPLDTVYLAVTSYPNLLLHDSLSCRAMANYYSKINLIFTFNEPPSMVAPVISSVLKGEKEALPTGQLPVALPPLFPNPDWSFLN